jgi:glucan phosphoethanolaminetransferase (alkaline phosphatase superfamily)
MKMENIGFAEIIAAIILYGIFYYILVTFFNTLSYKKLKMNVFEPGYQVFFGIEAILLLIFVNITSHTTFALAMKIGMGVLIIAGILFYLFLKCPAQW